MNDDDYAVFLICHDLKTIRLNRFQPITIGRENINDVIINDLLVSRQHAMIKWEEDGFYIQDLHSSNGTRLNGKKIEKSSLVEDGDSIKINNYEFTIRAASKMDVEKQSLQERGRRAIQETQVFSKPMINFIEQGFSGTLDTLSLVEVAQILSQCSKTGALTILEENHQDTKGVLYLELGEIVHAEHLSDQGFKAVASILQLSKGQFSFKDDVKAPTHTIHDSTMSILMDACRIIDEGS